MGIVQAPAILPGQVGVIGAIKYMVTTDSLSTLTTAGYLNNMDLAVNPILPSDILGVTYNYSTVTNSGSFGFFAVSISNGIITLSEEASSGIVLPTIANHIATYTNVTGTLSEDPATAISGGNIQAGLSGTAGTLASFPSAATSGKLVLAAVTNSSGNFNTTISNASSVAQSQVLSVPDTGQATSSFIMADSGGTQSIATGNLTITAGNETITAGNLVVTAGSITTTNGGVIQSGSSGHAGSLKVFPGTAANGDLKITCSNQSGNTEVNLNASAMGQASTINIPDPANATGQLLIGATATPFVSGNFPQNSGTAGLMIDSGLSVSSVSSVVTNVGNWTLVAFTLNQAAVQGSYATPTQLVATPGANKVLVPIWATVYTNFQTAAFANGGVGIVQYGNTAHGAGTNALAATIPAAEITAAASQIYNLAGNSANALTAVTNLGLFWSNQTGAFTAGNAASTVVITILYYTITATV
jgi:hypothetical protein